MFDLYRLDTWQAIYDLSVDAKPKSCDIGRMSRRAYFPARVASLVPRLSGWRKRYRVGKSFPKIWELGRGNYTVFFFFLAQLQNH